MTPEATQALQMKLSVNVLNRPKKEMNFLASEFITWMVIQNPEKVKEFLDVNEDLRKQFKIDVF